MCEKLKWVLLVMWVWGCATYYDPFDPYLRGIRFFDRRNFDLAHATWAPLASAGDCDAQYRMGTLYFLGAGVVQDYEAAHGWWRMAANQGQAFAQVLLATMYAQDGMSIQTPLMKVSFNCKNGCGVEKDPAAAYQWMKLAEKYTPYDDARQLARERSQKYAQSLTSAQISASDRYVQDWQPSPAPCRQRVID